MISGTTRTSGPYTGNGVQTLFPITFSFFSDSTLVRVKQKVISDDDDFGTVLVNPTHYTVVGANVVAVVAPAATKQWLIELVMPETQLYDYIDGGVFPNTDHETNLDRIYRTLQQIQDNADLAPKNSIFSAVRNAKLPAPSAGSVLVGNDDEDGWENGVSTADIESAVDYAAAAQAARDAAVTAKNSAQTAQTNAETAETAAEAALAAVLAAVAAISIGTPVAGEQLTGTVNDVNKVFTSAHTPNATVPVMVSVNGILTTDFVRVGATFTLTDAPVVEAAGPQVVRAYYNY